VIIRKLIYIRSAIAFMIIIFFNIGFSQSEQTTSISGFIYDSTNGEALIGANVYLSELGLGSSTNNSGYFVINSVPVGNQMLRVSYLGYASKNINLIVEQKQTKPFRIELAPESILSEEIVVSADSIKLIDKLFSKPVSKIEMSPKQINSIPKVIEADLLRSLQTMPGITALSDFSSALYIRGGTPDQNLYLVDGTDVYNPEHAFGIFSTFNTDAIKKVEVSKGGFGAEYGGRLSSVIDVTNLDGNRNNFEGIFNLSLISGAATLQMPVGSIGSISGSFRRTYIDQTYAKWIKEVPDYYFYDGNLKGFFELSEKDKLSISYFKSFDDLDFKLDKDAVESFKFLYNWGNNTGSVNWKHIFNTKIFTSFWVTASRFESNFNFNQYQNLDEKNYLSDYAFKGSAEYYASNDLTFKFGAEQKLMHFLYKQNWDYGLINVDYHRQLTTAYTSVNWKPHVLWDLEAGLRFNHFNAERNFTNLEPRFSVKYRLDESSNVKFATGIFHQYLNRIPRLFFSSIWTSADAYVDDSRSTHFILSYQKQFAEILELEAEVYYKDYKNIYMFNQNIGAEIRPNYHDENGKPVYNSVENLFLGGDGNSIGFEILLRKDVGAISGWIAYSLSRTENKFDAVNHGEEYIPRHDRSSVINFVLNGDIGNLFSGNWNIKPQKESSRWLFGLNFIYATGQPITVPASAYYAQTIPDWDNNGTPEEITEGYKLYPGKINSYSLPEYIRMDFSITWEKNFGGWSLSPYLQIFNIGNRQNIWFITYEDELKDGKIEQKIEEVNMLPFLPSIGVNVKF
jgi:hypothetical protein